MNNLFRLKIINTFKNPYKIAYFQLKREIQNFIEHIDYKNKINDDKILYILYKIDDIEKELNKNKNK